jgi:hypothetical protein
MNTYFLFLMPQQRFLASFLYFTLRCHRLSTACRPTRPKLISSKIITKFITSFTCFTQYNFSIVCILHSCLYSLQSLLPSYCTIGASASSSWKCHGRTQAVEIRRKEIFLCATRINYLRFTLHGLCVPAFSTIPSTTDSCIVACCCLIDSCPHLPPPSLTSSRGNEKEPVPCFPQEPSPCVQQPTPQAPSCALYTEHPQSIGVCTGHWQVVQVHQTCM